MPGSQYRITIQLDLGGYSFSIYDRNGTQIRQESHPCPVDLSVGELARELNWKAQAVSVYYTTWKYTLVPVSMYSKDAPEAALRSVRDLNPDDKVLILEMPSRKAIMIFAIPQKIYYGLTALNKNVKFYPMSYLLIDRISSITDNNRLLVSFTEGMLHIAAAERDRLLFCSILSIPVCTCSGKCLTRCRTSCASILQEYHSYHENNRGYSERQGDIPSVRIQGKADDRLRQGRTFQYAGQCL